MHACNNRQSMKIQLLYSFDEMYDTHSATLDHITPATIGTMIHNYRYRTSMDLIMDSSSSKLPTVRTCHL